MFSSNIGYMGGYGYPSYGWGGYYPRGYMAAGLGYPYMGGLAGCWGYPCGGYGYPYRPYI
jgi:hypothetical protein